MAELAVYPERHDGGALLRVSGDLDIASAGVLQAAADDQLGAADLGELALDLSDLTFLDSSGLGALLRIRGAALAQGATFTVAGVPPGPARIIAIAGLSTTFGIPES